MAHALVDQIPMFGKEPTCQYILFYATILGKERNTSNTSSLEKDGIICADDTPLYVQGDVGNLAKVEKVLGIFL